jgi:hypothetical protein
MSAYRPLRFFLAVSRFCRIARGSSPRFFLQTAGALWKTALWKQFLTFFSAIQRSLPKTTANLASLKVACLP